MATHTTQSKLVSAFAVAAVAFSLAAPVWAADDAALKRNAQDALANFKKADPSLSTRLAESVGFAIFPTVNKAAVGIGGAGGRGLVYEKGRPVGRVTLSQVTIGAQLGAQGYSELIFFESEHTLADFKRGQYALAAQASAVAVAAGASANAKYERGVQVFTLVKSGLMFEASVGGQQFKYEPLAKASKAPKAEACHTNPQKVLSRSSLHFDVNEAALTDQNKKFLHNVADAMKGCASAHVLIAGYADERGTAEHNMALGQRRANAARNFLINLGINASRLEVVSHGSSRPTDPSHTEAAWALNRRVDFSLKSPAVALR